MIDTLLSFHYYLNIYYYLLISLPAFFLFYILYFHTHTHEYYYIIIITFIIRCHFLVTCHTLILTLFTSCYYDIILWLCQRHYFHYARLIIIDYDYWWYHAFRYTALLHLLISHHFIDIIIHTLSHISAAASIEMTLRDITPLLHYAAMPRATYHAIIAFSTWHAMPQRCRHADIIWWCAGSTSSL